MELHTPKLMTGKSSGSNPAADRVMITYYTDPLCCWSWALEPHWNKLKAEYADRIQWKYVMGGMLEDWNAYNDPMNAITRPIQFGPVWMHASQISAQPIDFSIWHRDPPASSYPSCIAVVCAMLQSSAAGELLLHALREAVMTRAQNIARESVILAIAKSLSDAHTDVFNFAEFKMAWADGRGTDAFRRDLMETRFLRIGRYPTLTFTSAASRGIIITGYRPFDVLENALREILTHKEEKQNPS